jgi:Zn-dependent oligopeptidase
LLTAGGVVCRLLMVSLATAADLSSSFTSLDSGSWFASTTDLHEFLTRLESTGAYPSSLTGFRWDWDEAALKSLAGEIVARTKRVLDTIAALPSGAHTFANTLQALNDNDRIVDLWSTNISFLGHVSASKPLRDVATEMTKSLSEFEVSQGMRVDLYDAFKAFSETAEAKALTGEAARYLEFTLRDFKRNGLHLPLEQRQRIEALKKRMSTLGINFQQNLGEENAKFELTREQLGGVPDDQLARFPVSTTDPNKHVVTLKYPDYNPIMELCHVDSTRALLELNYNQRCMKENVPILEELVKLRAEQASLLGYKNHAAYVLEIRMAKSPDTVGPFLRDLSTKLTPLMEEELAYWKTLKIADKQERGEAVPDVVTIEPYDIRYFTRLSELKKYKVDDQAIKRYFPIEVVTQGLMEIYQRVLGFIFEEVKDRPAHSVWFQEVQLFRVLDADTRKLRGYFYLDLFPREGKYGHAAGEDRAGTRHLAIAVDSMETHDLVACACGV